MKRIISLALIFVMTISSASVFAEKSKDDKDFKNANSIIKEIAPGEFTAKKEVSFEELSNAMEVKGEEYFEKVKEENKDKLKEELTEYLGETMEEEQINEYINENVDNGINEDEFSIMSGELQGGTRSWYNSYGFNSVSLTSSTKWTNYPAHSTWDYRVQAYSNPNFADARVSHTMGLYGVTVQWPPLYQSYTNTSGWAKNNYTVALIGSDWGFGAWAYATAASNVRIARSSLYYTLNY